VIDATLERDAKGKIVSITLSGHALSGAYGQDVVCAAVSGLAINAFNSIEEFASFEPFYEMDKNSGYFYIEIIQEKINAKQAEIAQLLLESLWLGLKSIFQESGEYLNLKG